MKCPLRKITRYSWTGQTCTETIMVSCNKEQANLIVEEFANCIEDECMAYENGNCNVIGGVEEE